MMLILSPLKEGQLGHHQLKDEKQVLGGDDDENHDDDDHSSFDFNGNDHGNNNGVGLLDFPEFCGPGGMGNLLESIDFDDLFIGIHDGDVLPDLEMDSEMLDFSSTVPAQDFNKANADAKADTSAITNTTSSHHDQLVEEAAACVTSGNQNYSSSSTTTTTNTTTARDRGGDEEIASKLGDEEGNDEIIRTARRRHPLAPKEPSGDQKSARKSSSSTAQSNNSHGKRKVKVDWTAELHRRFVQAVEQLGVDKAVPSRILELMGIDCLTRHNIASHLQKYRSHRKHLLAREAEAASWTQRRQMYAGGGHHPVVVGGGGGGGKSSSRSTHDVVMMNNPNPNNWLTNHYVPPPPAMGFPPASISTNTTSTPPPPPPMHPLMIRPLHVWGHPTVDQSMMHMWPKHHLPHHNFPSPIPPPPGHAWPSPLDASYWHHRAPMNVLTPGTPCFPRQQRFGAPPVPGIPPHAMFKAAAPVAVAGGASGPTHPPPPPQLTGPNSALVDFHPSKESIDAAIGDVMSKPWLPLPLGLRPPATDTVMVELQRQGIPKIPPSCA